MATKIINALKMSDTYVISLPYGTCSTAAGTAAKTVSVDNFALETGAQVLVKFTYANTASSATLNVNSTGAKNIYYKGSAIPNGSYIRAGEIYQFLYNGTQWEIIGAVIAASAGDSNTPVYFSNGQPTACTGLDLNTTGNAATATKLATARTISLTGSVTGSGSFDGSGNLSIATTTNHSHSYLPLSGGTLSGTLKFSNALTQVTSPTVLACFVNNNSANGLGYCSCSDVTAGYAQFLSPFSGITTNSSTWDGAAETSDAVVMWRQAFKYSTYGTDSGDMVLKLRKGKYTSGGTELCMMIDGDYYSMGKRLWRTGDAITGAVWNDYAEYRESDCEEFGRVLVEKGDDTLILSTERLQPFAGISSDTWGFSQGETEKAKTPIAVAGRVLAFTYQDRNNYKPGDCVCAAPNGTVDIMTREEVINYPDRIIGTVSCIPDYEEWGGGNDRDPVKVNNRIWIKIK